MGQPERIRIDAIADQFPEDVGRVRINHDHCPAGLDTRKRLELTRSESGTLLAFCHHCKGWGVQSNSGVRSIHKRPTEKQLPDKSGAYSLPVDINFDTTTWPVEARVWPRKYGVNEASLKGCAIGYSPHFRRIIIPCYNEHRVLTGFQTRRVFEDDKKPKYLTYAKKGAKMFEPSGFPPRADNAIVFCEDALSAIKLSNVCQYPYAILGSDLPTSTLCAILDRYKNIDSIYVILDNDNKDIKSKQLKMFRRINLLSPYTTNKIVYLDKDPKEYSIAELESCLRK